MIDHLSLQCSFPHSSGLQVSLRRLGSLPLAWDLHSAAGAVVAHLEGFSPRAEAVALGEVLGAGLERGRKRQGRASKGVEGNSEEEVSDVWVLAAWGWGPVGPDFADGGWIGELQDPECERERLSSQPWQTGPGPI